MVTLVRRYTTLLRVVGTGTECTSEADLVFTKGRRGGRIEWLQVFVSLYRTERFRVSMDHAFPFSICSCARWLIGKTFMPISRTSSHRPSFSFG
jgi:hypothetical protein